jgi:hypothetical protein
VSLTYGARPDEILDRRTCRRHEEVYTEAVRCFLNSLVAGTMCIGENLLCERRGGRNVHPAAHGDQTIHDPLVVAVFPLGHNILYSSQLLRAVEFLAKIIEETEGRCQ